MTDQTPVLPQRPEKPWEGWLEIGSAVALSIAALMTSWASYQAALWDGEQAAAYTQANAKHMAAARMSTRAGQLQAIDVLAFAEWVNAHAAEKTTLERYYETQFRPEFAAAFRTWRARDPLHDPSAPRSPFFDPAYQSATERQASAVEHEAAALFEKGQSDNSISDHYVQASVILASALFFGGIAQVFHKPRVRLVLVAIATVACAYATIRLFQLPSLSL